MALYAGFGRNLDPAAMASRAPNSPAVAAGWLNGWRLTFGGEDLSWQGALPTIVEDPASQVYVMLYSLNESDEQALDLTEGLELGHYRKIHVRVSTMDRDESAWTYVLEGYEGGYPRQAMLDEIITAAIAANAPDDYVARLRLWTCADD